MDYYFLFFFFFVGGVGGGEWVYFVHVFPVINIFLSECVQPLQQEDTYLWEDDDDR